MRAIRDARDMLKTVLADLHPPEVVLLEAVVLVVFCFGSLSFGYCFFAIFCAFFIWLFCWLVFLGIFFWVFFWEVLSFFLSVPEEISHDG